MTDSPDRTAGATSGSAPAVFGAGVSGALDAGMTADADGDGAGGGAEAATNWVAQSSELIQNALNLVTDGKFIGLLTIMFGIGLPIDWYLRLSDPGFAGTTRYITSAMVAFGVLALVAEFYVRHTRRADAGDIPADKVVGRALSLVGRMALTCYIGQNLIASIIFYEWGFGFADMIAGQWYTYWTLLIYLGIAALLVAFSALWLRRFPRGPVELVWHWSYEAICAALDRRKEKKEAKAAAKRAAGDTTSAAAATGSASPSAT
ncbi:hypothetical protein CJ204_08725 [Corynebacterium xerosis]|uniref:DUF418 domain-containing protein n=1 Tax=Corynebacterium xerosis TaxID=1725 RepID=A0A2N6SXU6_9CORY|nr:DUF418 domain-containing protein [Corynebacterium xerosis]PMC61895.1 hypothetical protein CJ204_08725 [Corynebacterium xerosis]